MNKYFNSGFCVSIGSGFTEEILYYNEFVDRLFKKGNTDVESMIHASMGISGEAGEIIDAIKKTWIYNKPLDVENIKEEIGDVLFYLTELATLVGYSLEEAMLDNAKKLEKRYPTGKYSDADAQARADKNQLTHYVHSQAKGDTLIDLDDECSGETE